MRNRACRLHVVQAATQANVSVACESDEAYAHDPKARAPHMMVYSRSLGGVYSRRLATFDLLGMGKNTVQPFRLRKDTTAISFSIERPMGIVFEESKMACVAVEVVPGGCGMCIGQCPCKLTAHARVAGLFPGTRRRLA